MLLSTLNRLSPLGSGSGINIEQIASRYGDLNVWAAQNSLASGTAVAF